MKFAELVFRAIFIFALFIFLLELVRNPKGVQTALNSFWSGIAQGYSYELAAGSGGKPARP